MPELMVLGSGGPFVNPQRASSGYVLTSDDGSRLLMDAGGGAFERLGRAGVGAADFDLVLLTHLHIDHSGGLAPIIFSAFLEGRTKPLTVAGPTPRDGQPGARRFCEALFGVDGAWSFMHSFDGFAITPLESSSELQAPTPQTVVERKNLRVTSVAVPHGMMPAVAYRIECDGRSVVYSGDVQRAYAPLVELAAGCDLLVHDLALPERAIENGELHAKPSEVGQVARDCGCRRLLVTHVMPALENELDDALTQVRLAYDGELIVAEDLMRIRL
jgi:ribonuclease BN (tRNA processing enzyme)